MCHGLNAIHSSGATDRDDDSSGKADAQVQLISRLEMTEHNQDKLLIDATCGPVEVRHPTDFSLLNEAQKLTETLSDTMISQVRDSI
ncbi:hypothetical protein ACLM45_03325 [Synechococcus sp. A10-1-5-9]|uniref:hypothetical protein n=1 Tax=Synechococcus sp. A10-1-5-9 TaxID=3392295 RepID=UPI0039E9A558